MKQFSQLRFKRSHILSCLISSLTLTGGLPALAHDHAHNLATDAKTTIVAPSGKLVWITLGDKAFTELKAAVPGTQAKASKLHQSAVGEYSRQEQVHLVQVDEAHLSTLSAAVHSKLRQCGGFMA
ncbi:MAG: hypothetical protein RL748_756, partial [Pseudomonadota bacterium]